MARLLKVLILVSMAACAAEPRSQVVLPPDGIATDSTGAIERHFVADSLMLFGQAGGGSDRDTTFLDPYLLTATRDRVYIVDADQRVLAYDTLGHRIWRTGQTGSGPGEYRNIRDIKIGSNQEVWVNDPATARITRLDRDGKVRGFVSLQRVGHSEVMAPGPSGVSLLPAYADADILVIDTGGVVIDRDTILWPGYRQLENLSRQVHLASDPVTGRWVMGFQFGNGWFAFDAQGGSARRYYVEPTRFPAVVREVSNGGQTVATKLVRGDLSGASISLSGDTVFVLFGGKDKSREKLDLYSWTSGNYLGSIALPEKVDDAAVAGSFIYTITSVPLPKLVVYRRWRG
jgi:hypothetical protein